MADNNIPCGANPLENVLHVDGVQGEWYVNRHNGKPYYVCDYGVCHMHGGRKFGDHQRLNIHRRKHHPELGDVPERRRGPRPASDTPSSTSTYSRDRYDLMRKDLKRVLSQQYYNEFYREKQKWYQKENVLSYDKLFEEAKTKINEAMRKYESEEKKRKRIKAFYLKKDLKDQGHLTLEDILAMDKKKDEGQDARIMENEYGNIMAKEQDGGQDAKIMENKHGNIVDKALDGGQDAKTMENEHGDAMDKIMHGHDVHTMEIKHGDAMDKANLRIVEDGTMTAELLGKLLGEETLAADLEKEVANGASVSLSEKEGKNDPFKMPTVTEIAQIQQTIRSESDGVEISERRVYLLGENRWE